MQVIYFTGQILSSQNQIIDGEGVAHRTVYYIFVKVCLKNKLTKLMVDSNHSKICLPFLGPCGLGKTL